MALFRHKWLVALSALLLAGIPVVHYLRPDAPLFAGGLAAAILLAGTAFSILDWPSHDEASRAAMKDAWLWGSTVGIAIMGMAVVLLWGAHQAGITVHSSPMRQPGEYIAAGVVATLICQLFGSGVVWCWWWISKR